MLHQTFPFLGQLWQLFEVSQILEFLRYALLHDWQLIRNLQWNFVHTSGCQFHIVHTIYMTGDKLIC